MMLENERREIVAQAAMLVERGLVVGSSGNVSARRDDLFAITPARGWLGHIEPSDCPILNLDGGVIDGSREPSSETPMHRAIYRAHRPGAIVHTHSVFATTLSTLVEEIPPIHYIVGLFGGPIPVVPYALFGTEVLAESTAQALAKRRGVLLQNHGAVTTGESIREACGLALQLEWLASVYYHATVATNPRILTQAELVEATAMMQRRYGHEADQIQ